MVTDHARAQARVQADERDDEIRFGLVEAGAYGRNGWVNTSGLVLFHHPGEPDVRLRPITSHNRVCRTVLLRIPVYALPELIRELERIHAGPLGRMALDAPKDARPSQAQPNDEAGSIADPRQLPLPSGTSSQ